LLAIRGLAKDLEELDVGEHVQPLFEAPPGPTVYVAKLEELRTWLGPYEDGQKDTTCRKCHGKKALTCETCGGSGQHDCECGHTHDCGHCDGDGVVRCFGCGGEGTVQSSPPGRLVAILGNLLDANLLAKALRRAEDESVGLFWADEETLVVIGDGWRAVVASCRGPVEDANGKCFPPTADPTPKASDGAEVARG
jgi:hypothetical protein